MQFERAFYLHLLGSERMKDCTRTMTRKIKDCTWTMKKKDERLYQDYDKKD